MLIFWKIAGVISWRFAYLYGLPNDVRRGSNLGVREHGMQGRWLRVGDDNGRRGGGLSYRRHHPGGLRDRHPSRRHQSLLHHLARPDDRRAGRDQPYLGVGDGRSYLGLYRRRAAHNREHNVRWRRTDAVYRQLLGGQRVAQQW